MLIGAVLADAYQNRAGEFVKVILEHGVLISGAGSNVLRFAPSLLLNDEDLNEAMTRVKQAILSVQAA